MKQLSRKIKAKLRSRKGETLIEIMVSITVCLFSIISLLTAITFTSKVTADSRTLMNEYYDANNKIEKMISGASEKETDDNISVYYGTIKVSGNDTGASFVGSSDKEYTVDIYVNSSVAAGSPPVVIYKYNSGEVTSGTNSGSDSGNGGNG